MDRGEVRRRSSVILEATVYSLQLNSREMLLSDFSSDCKYKILVAHMLMAATLLLACVCVLLIISILCVVFVSLHTLHALVSHFNACEAGSSLSQQQKLLLS